MATDVEIAAMNRALELAAKGPPSRNPQVGSVILSPTDPSSPRAGIAVPAPRTRRSTH